MINIMHCYCAHVHVIFYSDDCISLRYDDVGTMDELVEAATEIIVKHNFMQADITSAETGELLVQIERS